jgi:hypothetical protein
MKNLLLFEAYTKWYRGYTTNTNNGGYIWLTKNKKMAEVYSIINTATYGGDKIVGEFKVDLKNKNILDLSEYDTDDRLEEHELEDFLNYIQIEYEDIFELFDFTEDDIPLSRLVNKILENIMDRYDVLKIKEFGKVTICVRKEFVIKIS